VSFGRQFTNETAVSYQQPLGRIFHEIRYLSILRKSVKKIQVSLKSHKNNGYSAWRPIYMFYRIALSSS